MSRVGLLVLLLMPTWAAAAEPSAVRLADLLEEARRTNPALAAMRAEAAAASALEPQARALPDPLLRGMDMPELAETRLELEQMFPLAGKRGLAAGMARRGAKAARQRVRAEELRTVLEVTEAYLEYWVLARAREITLESQRLVEGWQDVARVRYAGGRGSQQVVLKVDVELGVLDNRLRSIDQVAPTWVERLNALLDRRPGTPLALPPADDLVELELALDLRQLRARLAEASPELSALAEEIERTRLGEAAADRARVPDLTLGVRYTRERMAPDPVTGVADDRDSYMAAVGVNLPLAGSKYRALRSQARHERAAAEHRLEAGTNGLEARLAQLHFEYQDAKRRLSLYRDRLIPRARQTVAAAFSEFQTGAGGFLDLVDAQRQLLDFGLEEAQAMAGHRKSLAALEALVGEPVSRPAPPAPAPPAGP